MKTSISSFSWEEKLCDLGALWQHDGNPVRPHVILHDGDHSGFYIESSLITIDPLTLSKAAYDSVKSLMSSLAKEQSIDFVVGPAFGGILFGYEIAMRINLCQSESCFFTYTKKTETEAGQVHKLNAKIKPRSKVLLVDDVLTTGDSLAKTAEAVERAEGELLPFVLVLVNRSGKERVDGREVISLIDKEMPKWKPEIGNCPFCRLGSEAIFPEGIKNWSRLNAQY